MNRIFIVTAFVLFYCCGFSQTWNTVGNAAGSGDFIGTTNAQDLLLKTNNSSRITLGTNGTITLNDFTGSGAGIIAVSGTGNLSRINFVSGTANVLCENGSFAAIESLSGWKASGTDAIMGVTGNVGMGTTSPAYKLDVAGQLRVSGKIMTPRISMLPGDTILYVGDSTLIFYPNSNRISSSVTGTYRGLALGYSGTNALGLQSFAIGNAVRTLTGASNSVIIGSGAGGVMTNNIPNSLMIGFKSDIPTLFISPSNGPGTTGTVCIGTTYVPGTNNPSPTLNYKLAVAGWILAEEVQVKLAAQWPDFVFDSGYHLPALTDVDAYIRENNHLPGIPSAAEAEADGVPLGRMNALLLQKVEELTLYSIQQSNQITALAVELEKLKLELHSLNVKSNH